MSESVPELKTKIETLLMALEKIANATTFAYHLPGGGGGGVGIDAGNADYARKVVDANKS